MRTTVTLDPDVSERIRERMRISNLGFKEVINQLLRAGLRAEAAPHSGAFVVEPHPCGFQPGIDLDKLNQLVDELDVGDAARVLSR